MQRLEILAPAGNPFKLRTAVRYGADAVYIAGQRYGLRSAADNFSLPEIADGCRFAHAAGAKVYVVLNGFLFDEDLADLPDFVRAADAAGVDAYIISDMGVVHTVRNHSHTPIHLSTQASVINRYAASFWREQGVTRIVLGRECTIEEGSAIRREADVEVEMFAHGAMCMAFSGHCTISNYTAGRDSNRGGCIQSCRFRYRLSDERGGDGPSQFLLSSKDLQGIEHMPRFVAGGIDSVKIEGRMKSALYVATTVRAYARARDRHAALGESELDQLFRELNSMSHRDYTDASLAEKAGADSIFHHEPHQSAHSHELAGYVIERLAGQHLAIQLKNPLLAGELLEMLTPNTIEVLATDAMRDLRGKHLERAKPNQVVLLPDNSAAQAEFVLRKPRHAVDHSLAVS